MWMQHGKLMVLCYFTLSIENWGIKLLVHLFSDPWILIYEIDLRDIVY